MEVGKIFLKLFNLCRLKKSSKNRSKKLIKNACDLMNTYKLMQGFVSRNTFKEGQKRAIVEHTINNFSKQTDQ